MFNKPNVRSIGINEFIWINILIYVFFSILWLFSTLLKAPQWFDAAYYLFSLSSEGATLLSRPWTLITYAWLHDIPSPLHILFNMLGLYWFGAITYDLIGARRFVFIYFYGIVVGALFYLVLPKIIPVISYPTSILVGSSAAIYAVMTAAATIAPEYEFSFFIIGRIKIVYIVLAAIFVSIIGIGMTNVGGNVSHLGGAFIGFVYIKLLHRGYDIGNVFSIFKKAWNQKNMKVVYKNPSKVPSQEIKSAEIDRILDKINKSGYESLTKDEKQKLFNASKE